MLLLHFSRAPRIEIRLWGIHGDLYESGSIFARQKFVWTGAGRGPLQPPLLLLQLLLVLVLLVLLLLRLLLLLLLLLPLMLLLLPLPLLHCCCCCSRCCCCHCCCCRCCDFGLDLNKKPESTNHASTNEGTNASAQQVATILTKKRVSESSVIICWNKI